MLQNASNWDDKHDILLKKNKKILKLSWLGKNI